MYNPEKQKKAKALGYPENDYTLYHKLSVKDFIANESAIDALQNTSEICIDDERMLNHPKTTKEIIECCKDIKVLGRKDLRSLLNWWKILKEQFDEKESKDGDDKESEEKEEERPLTLEEQEDLEDDQIVKDIESLKEEQAKEVKRKKKKVCKERTKLNQKLNLNMVHKGDQGPIEECDDMFSLKHIQTRKDLNEIIEQSPDVVAESDSEEEVPVSKKVRYEKEAGHLDSKGLYYKDEDSELEFSEDDGDDDESVKSGLGLSDDEDEGTKTVKPVPKKVKFQENSNGLLTDLDPRDKKSKKVSKAELWFERDIFKNILDETTEELEINNMIENYKAKGGKIIGDDDAESSGNDEKVKRDDEDDDDDDDDDDTDSDSDYDAAEMNEPEAKSKKVGGKDGFEVVSKECKSCKPFS